MLEWLSTENSEDSAVNLVPRRLFLVQPMCTETGDGEARCYTLC